MLHSKSGSAIIIVLIISIISMSLTLFAIGVSRRIVQSSNMLMDKLHAEFGVESEIEKLKFYVSTGRFYSSYVKNSYQAGFPQKLYVDGRVQKIDDNTSLSIQDAGGMIDVWAINTDVIKSLLNMDNISKTQIAIISDSISDWYDKDNLRRINGAESAYYKSKGYEYTPRNFNGIQSIYELHLIRGLTDNKTFDFLKKYLIIPTKWHTNINTMDEYMLSAFFNIPESVAEVLVKIRKVKGYISTEDISSVFGIKNSDAEYTNFPTFVLDINAEFRFNVAVEKESCVISFKADASAPYKVLKWQN